MFSDKIEYISDKANNIKHYISSYKVIKYYNEFDEIDKKVVESMDNKKDQSNSNSKENEMKNIKENKEYDINEIIKNFNASKDLFDNLLKDLKSSVNEIPVQQVENNSNITTNYTVSAMNTNNAINVSSKNLLQNSQNNFNLTPNYLIQNNAQVFYNVYNYENSLENKTDNQLKSLISQMTKENTSLKLELKILYDTMKQGNLISEICREDLEKGNFDLKVVKKTSHQASPELTFKPKSNFTANSNEAYNSKSTNYVIKLLDENMKENLFLDVKKYINSLKQIDFFL